MTVLSRSDRSFFPVRGDGLRGVMGVIMAGGYRFFLARNQCHLCLEFLSKEFKKDITDERGYCGDCKICSGKNISDCPS
jgi:hypothetical protein